ncbi:hypothetical protein BDR07DRAFT_392478 [Suillus spraguei]|nr:hypothetical protein BDR07DRAFT_392478 [Suillus spraguei]
MLFKSFFIAAVAALAVNAQSGNATSSSADPAASGAPSPCIIGCSTQAAAQSDCISYTNLTCVCSSTAFQDAAGACLQANCTTAEIAQANTLQQDECATLSNSSTATTTSSTPISTPTTSSSAKTSATAATSSGAATGLVPSLALNSAFGGLVALAGVFIGAALVV